MSATDVTTEDVMLDVKAVAALLGVPKSWVYASAASGALPHFKIGHYLRFRRSEVLAWLEAQRHSPVTQQPQPQPRHTRRGPRAA